MAINTNYYNYSNSLFSTTGSASPYKSSNQLSSLLSGYKSSYGVNSANALSSSAQSFVTNAKSESGVLQNALNNLIGKNKKNVSVFNEQLLTSSNLDLMSIKASDKTKDTSQNLSVKIDQVASAQVNKGAELQASAKNYSSQKFQIEVEVNGKKNQISFSTSAGDTNKAVQQKMADAINNKKLGITATVSFNEKDGKSVLSVQSNDTGDLGKNKFSIKDVEGNAVTRTGVDVVEKEAQDAIYSINGGDKKTSHSNNVDLGNGITATLKKASADEAKVVKGMDKEGAINKVREMVNGFNGLLAAAEENNSDTRSAGLQKQLKGLAKTYSSSLARIGINADSDGYLSIDKDKMDKASNNGSLEKFFTDDKNSNYGFANRLSKTSNDVNANTISYVSKASTNKGTSSYVDPAFSYLQTNRMNQILNTGLIFDFMF